MWLLHKNYAVTTKLSNPASTVPKCPKDTSKPVPDMPECPRSKVWKVRSVFRPKCLYTVLYGVVQNSSCSSSSSINSATS